MQTFFDIKRGRIVESTSKDSAIHVIVSPTKEDKAEIMQRLGVDSFDFDAALDPDEISRVEFEQDHTVIIWSFPYKPTYTPKAQFDVMSVGLFIHNDTLIMVTREDDIPFENVIFDGVNSIYDVLLRYFFYTIRQYANHLKGIKHAKSKLEGKLSYSVENKYFLQMFNISESLVYYIDAIEANGGVLSKILAKTAKPNGERLNLTPQQIDFLEDTIQENQQMARQANIYSTVLSGLMDARGNVINNNMNVLLKNLTLINVVFLPLNLLASMGGMSEFSMMIGDFRLNWRIGYLLFSIAMVIIGWITWITLKRQIGRPSDEELE